MAIADQILLAVVLVIIAIVVIAFFELKYMRKSMHKRRARAAKRIDDLPDDAYNSLVTTKAILASMDRGGLHSEEAAVMLRDAKTAYDRGNYRVTLDLTSQAKERLMVLKARQKSEGDASKLETLGSPGLETLSTTKEVLQKEYPANYLQSKFSMELATGSIEAGRSSGRDVNQAVQLLDSAHARFDAEDYDGALAAARLADRSARGEAVEVTLPATSAASTNSPSPTCASCGAQLQPDDIFCRKCGSRVA